MAYWREGREGGGERGGGGGRGHITHRQLHRLVGGKGRTSYVLTL